MKRILALLLIVPSAVAAQGEAEVASELGLDRFAVAVVESGTHSPEEHLGSETLPIPIDRPWGPEQGGFHSRPWGEEVEAEDSLRRTRGGGLADTTVRPLLIVSSGGISLGAYQAGVNWAFLSLLHQARTDPNLGLPRFELAVATGASAGSINTLLMTAEWARPSFSTSPPDSSLFWKFWTGLGIAELLPEGRRGTTETGCLRNESLLSRCYIREIMVPQVVNALRANVRGDDSLNVSIGVMVTRLDPVEVPLSDDGRLRVRTVRSASIFRARGPGSSGGRLRFYPEQAAQRSRVWDPRGLGNLIHLPFVPPGPLPTPTDKQNDDRVIELVMASSAFPYAWAPIRMTFADSVYSDGTLSRSNDALFVDGGLFDNNPLSLAYELYRYRLSESADQGHNWGAPFAVYVDPDDLRGPRRPTRTASGSLNGLSAVAKLFGALIPAGREYELEVLARSLPPDLRGTLRSSDRRFPVVGEHLGAFGAFLARPFREYDFYVGVYDGFRFTARTLLCETRVADPTCEEREAERLFNVSGYQQRDPVGSHIFNVLLRRERSANPDDPSFSADCPLTLSGDDARRCVVLTQTLAALLSARPRSDSTSLSVSHFTRFVEGLNTSDVSRIVGEWADECPDEFRLGNPGSGPNCPAEPYVPDLLRAPERWLYAFAHQALLPATLLEDNSGSDWEPVIDVARLALAVVRAPAHVGFRFSESTASTPSGGIYGVGSYKSSFTLAQTAFRNLPPYGLAFGTGGGFTVQWQPAYRVSPRLAVSASLSPYNGWRLYDPAVPEMTSEIHAFRSVGLGALVSPVSFLDVDVRAMWGSPWSSVADRESEVSWGLEGGVTALHFFRIGASAPDLFQSSDPFLNRKWQLTFGIQDLPGFIFWASKLGQ